MGGLANSVRPRSPRADDNQREGPRPSTHGIFSTSRLPHATRPPGRADGNCRRTITGGAEPPGPRNAARGQRCGASPAARRQVGHGAGLPAALYTPPGCQGRHSRTSKPTSGTWATWQACTRDQRAAVPNPASSPPLRHRRPAISPSDPRRQRVAPDFESALFPRVCRTPPTAHAYQLRQVALAARCEAPPRACLTREHGAKVSPRCCKRSEAVAAS